MRIETDRISYRQRRWPRWDPGETEWQPLHMNEQPQTWWQAFRGAGLRGARWLRSYRQQDALLDSQYRSMLFKDRYRAERMAQRREAGLVDDERRRAWVPPTERQLIWHRIRCRPYGSVFWNHELSSDVALADEVLQESAAETDSGLEELAPGFWCYGLPPSKIADGEGPMMLSPAYVGLRHAGVGSGFASMHALNHVGWTTQMTAKCRLAVMDGTPEPLSAVVVHEYRDNPGRLALTWAEITLIEALQTISMAEKPVSRICEEINNTMTLRSLGPNTLLRRECIMSAIEAEAQPARDRGDQIAVVECMPERLSSNNLFAGTAIERFWEQI